MKKILKVVGVALCLVAFTQNSKAQFGVGLDLSMPLGDFGKGYGIGLGGSVSYDHAIGDNMKIGGQVGYLRFGGKNIDEDPNPLYDADFSSSLAMIPILGNFKYYFADNTNGFYGIASIGMSMTTWKSSQNEVVGYDFATGKFTLEKKSYSDSKTYLTFGFGAGYLINEKIDLSVRYMSVSSEGSASNFINLRAAYNF